MSILFSVTGLLWKIVNILYLFSLALVQLLIEGGSYSRVAFINIGLISILGGVIQKNCSTEG